MGLWKRRQRVDTSRPADDPAAGSGVPAVEARESSPASPSSTPMHFGVPSSGVVVNETTAMAYSVVWACVRVISGTVMTLPIEERRATPDGHDVLVGDNSDLLTIAASDEMTASTFRETIEAHALVWGNGYAEIERDRGGRVVAMYPIDPWRVRVVRTQSGDIVYEVSNGSGANTVLDRLSMFHLRGLGPDGIVGYSVVGLARRAIGLGIAVEEFGSSFFGNGARSSGVLTHPSHLSDDAIRHLRESMAGKQGVHNAGKPWILEEGMSYQPLSIPPDDAQFLQTREFQVRDIGPRWFGVPSFMLGDDQGAKFANMEQLNIMYANTTLAPWLTRWESEYNTKLYAVGSRDGRSVKFDMRSLLRGDTATRSAFHKTMFGIGVMSPNDIRRVEGWNAVEGGDIRLVPMNMVPLDMASDGPIQNAPPVQRGAPPGDGDSQSDAVDTHPIASIGAVGAVDAIAPLVESAVCRVLTKECRAANRAHDAGKAMDNWARGWLGSDAHRSYLCAELGRPIVAVVDAAASGFIVDLPSVIESVVDWHIECSTEMVSSGDIGDDSWDARRCSEPVYIVGRAVDAATSGVSNHAVA